MELEQKFVEYILYTQLEDIPPRAVNLMKDIVLNTLAGVLAGANTPGCSEAVAQSKAWGGKEEATLLVYGDRLPACQAVFANSFMARAAATSESLVSGLHTGASSVPTGLAAAELIGGCSGKEFLTALIVATEIAARIDACTVYNGFDPTGVCGVFATAAITGRILGLTREQMLNALGHAFNRSGGSFQGTLDGSMGARLIQAGVSQSGIMCAQLAQRGITGPGNFLGGTYGYFHLYAGGKYDPTVLTGEWGERFEFYKTQMKKYPNCGTTNGSVDAIFDLMEGKGIALEDLNEIKVTVTPHSYNMVGKPFQYGSDARISAIYSIQYGVANALLRKGCKLRHYDESGIKEPKIMEIAKMIHVSPDPALLRRNPLATDMEVRMKSGAVYHKSVDYPRGVWQNPLTREELMEKFEDCASYGGSGFSEESIKGIISSVYGLEQVKDVRSLIPLLIRRD
jgi:2-methylcitrate dehydratase PrpD